MSTQAIIFIAAGVVILLAIVFRDKVKATFGGLKISSDNSKEKNRADVKGEENELTQGGHVTNKSVSNEAKVDGKKNKVHQG